MKIESGEVIGMYSDYDNDINLFFSLLNGLVSPKRNDGHYAGEVMISDINIATFGQVCKILELYRCDRSSSCSWS